MSSSTYWRKSKWARPSGSLWTSSLRWGRGYSYIHYVSEIRYPGHVYCKPVQKRLAIYITFAQINKWPMILQLHLEMPIASAQCPRMPSLDMWKSTAPTAQCTVYVLKKRGTAAYLETVTTSLLPSNRVKTNIRNPSSTQALLCFDNSFSRRDVFKLYVKMPRLRIQFNLICIRILKSLTKTINNPTRSKCFHQFTLNCTVSECKKWLILFASFSII